MNIPVAFIVLFGCILAGMLPFTTVMIKLIHLEAAEIDTLSWEDFFTPGLKRFCLASLAICLLMLYPAIRANALIDAAYRQERQAVQDKWGAASPRYTYSYTPDTGVPLRTWPEYGHNKSEICLLIPWHKGAPQHNDVFCNWQPFQPPAACTTPK